MALSEKSIIQKKEGSQTDLGIGFDMDNRTFFASIFPRI